MSANPYAPPVALVEDVPEVAIGVRPRRPLSVCALQVLAALLAVAFAHSVVTVAMRLLSGQAVNVPLLVAKLTLDLLATALLVVMIVGSNCRWRPARWAGLVFIALIFGLLALVGMEVATSTSGPSDVDGSGARSTTVSLVMLALGMIPTGFWFWAYGFSAKARTWFALRPRGSQAAQ